MRDSTKANEGEVSIFKGVPHLMERVVSSNDACIPSFFLNLFSFVTKAETPAGYDCVNNNPCTPDNIAQERFYHQHSDPKKFVQCDQWGQCFVMNCGTNTEWSQQDQTCVKSQSKL